MWEVVYPSAIDLIVQIAVYSATEVKVSHLGRLTRAWTPSDPQPNTKRKLLSIYIWYILVEQTKGRKAQRTSYPQLIEAVPHLSVKIDHRFSQASPCVGGWEGLPHTWQNMPIPRGPHVKFQSPRSRRYTRWLRKSLSTKG